MKIKEIGRNNYFEIRLENHKRILVDVHGYKNYIDNCAYPIILKADQKQLTDSEIRDFQMFLNDYIQGKSFFVYNGVVYMLDGKVSEMEAKPLIEKALIEEANILAEKIKILSEYNEIKNKKKLEKMKREIDLYKQKSSIETQLREAIPEEVRSAVWRRDQAKCVKCGSQEKLEFDHIIPVSKGGSNTARNIQILCERCNREKSNFI